MTSRYDWHRRPKRTSRARCEICGCPIRCTGEHRATGRSEGIARKFLMRDRDGNISEAGALWLHTKTRLPPGPTKATLAKIAQAAALATTATIDEVAGKMNTTAAYVFNLQNDYPELWKRAYDHAMSATVEFARQTQQAKAILQDPDRYLDSASRADAWLREQGQELFPPADSETLPDFFDRYYRPVCMAADASNGTLSHYRTILRRWYLIHGNLPLREITTESLALFRDVLMRSRGLKATQRMSPNTVASYMSRIQWFLDKAGPPAPRNRDAAGILVVVPWIKPPRQRLKVPTIVSEETLNRLYEGAALAEMPSVPGIKAPAWWRALLVLVFNTGLRRGSLFALRVSDIDWQAGKLIVPANRMKTGSEHRLPLNDVVMRHLRAIRTDREKLLAWPHDKRHFDTVFHKLQDACGIPRAEHVGLHQLRRTNLTSLWGVSPEAARLVAGHSTFRTTINHYVNAESIMAEAVKQLPQPLAFTGEKEHC